MGSTESRHKHRQVLWDDLQFIRDEHSRRMMYREHVKEFEESVSERSSSVDSSTTLSAREPSFATVSSPSFASFMSPDDDEYEVLVPAPYDALVPDPSFMPRPICVVPAPPLPIVPSPLVSGDGSKPSLSAPTLPSLLDLIIAKIAEMKVNKQEMASKEEVDDVVKVVVVQDIKTDKVSWRIRMFGFFKRVKNSFKQSFKHGKRRGISSSATSSSDL